MKIRKLWLPTLIIGIIGGAALICDTIFNLSGSGFFLSSEICGAVFIISLILAMIIAFGTSISERSTEIQAVPEKNVPAAVFGFLASVSLIGSGVVNLLSLGASDSLAITLIMCVLSLGGGIVMLYESCISYTGHNGMSKRQLLALVPVLWALGRLVSMFMNYQRVSLYAAVKYDVLVVSLLLLFLYYQALFLTETNPSVSVRRMSVYGTPFIIFGVIVCADILLKMFLPHNVVDGVDSIVINPTVSRILSCVGDLSFAGYAAFFIAGVNRSAVFTEEEGEDDEDTEFLEELSGAKEKRLKEEALAAEKAEKERAEKEAEEKRRIEAEREAEEKKRIEAEREAEEKKRIEAEREAEEKKRIEAAREAEDRRRIEAEKEAEEKRLAEEKAAQEQKPEKAKPEPVSEDFDSFDDGMFDDPAEEDYAEIFRMLDEMSDE